MELSKLNSASVKNRVRQSCLICQVTRVILEDILLCDVNQAQKHNYNASPSYVGFKQVDLKRIVTNTA